MGYQKAIYNRALAEIQNRGNKIRKEYESILGNAYVGLPRLGEIDRASAALGAASVTAALSGDTEKLEKYKTESAALLAEKQEILKKAGVKKPEFSCSACEDTGFVNGILCNCVKETAKRMVLENLSESMPIGENRFEKFDLKYYSDKPDADGIIPRKVMTAIFQMAQDYALNFSPSSKNLLFMGGVGLGKTHLSLSIVAAVTEKGYGAVYGSAQNLFSAVEKEHFSYTGSEEKLNALLTADLLVIDDLGTEFTTSFTQSLFYNIINTRLLTNKPTILSTNLTFKEIEERYTPRISSRFVGSYELIKFFGTDIRQQKRMESI